MLTNTALADAVMERLDGDPQIPDSIEIAVSAEGAIVTLRGTVETFSQRLAAVQDGNEIDDVDEVDDQLEVNPPATIVAATTRSAARPYRP